MGDLRRLYTSTYDANSTGLEAVSKITPILTFFEGHLAESSSTEKSILSSIPTQSHASFMLLYRGQLITWQSGESGLAHQMLLLSRCLTLQEQRVLLLRTPRVHDLDQTLHQSPAQDNAHDSTDG